ncbi:MAG: hypothetical protein LBD79_07830 [Treponema sp.]|nr:hypothetical protein [Treponema sp.]
MRRFESARRLYLSKRDEACAVISDWLKNGISLASRQAAAQKVQADSGLQPVPALGIPQQKIPANPTERLIAFASKSRK